METLSVIPATVIGSRALRNLSFMKAAPAKHSLTSPVWEGVHPPLVAYSPVPATDIPLRLSCSFSCLSHSFLSLWIFFPKEKFTGLVLFKICRNSAWLTVGAEPNLHRAHGDLQQCPKTRVLNEDFLSSFFPYPILMENGINTFILILNRNSAIHDVRYQGICFLYETKENLVLWIIAWS